MSFVEYMKGYKTFQNLAMHGSVGPYIPSAHDTWKPRVMTRRKLYGGSAARGGNLRRRKVYRKSAKYKYKKKRSSYKKRRGSRRRSYGKRTPKWMAKYSKPLAAEVTLKDEFPFSMNTLGDNVNNLAVYHCFIPVFAGTLDDIIANAADEAGSATAAETMKVLVKYCSTVYTFKCNFEVGCKVEAWLCSPRRDIFDTSLGAFAGADPAALMVGGAAETRTTTLSMSERISTPYNSKMWTSLFKLKKVYSKILSPGEQAAIKYTHSGTTISMAKYNASGVDTITTNNLIIKRFGAIMLFKVSGLMVHNESIVTAAAGTMDSLNLAASWGPFNVDFIASRVIKYCRPLLQDQETVRIGRENSALTTYTAANMATFQPVASVEVAGPAP